MTPENQDNKLHGVCLTLGCDLCIVHPMRKFSHGDPRQRPPRPDRVTWESLVCMVRRHRVKARMQGLHPNLTTRIRGCLRMNCMLSDHVHTLRHIELTQFCQCTGDKLIMILHAIHSPEIETVSYSAEIWQFTRCVVRPASVWRSIHCSQGLQGRR